MTSTLKTQNVPITDEGPTTQQRLTTIVQGFDEFELDMRRGTRQRREKEEFRISELKNEMKRLDKDLVAEIKRRTEMNKSTQMVFYVIFLILLLLTIALVF